MIGVIGLFIPPDKMTERKYANVSITFLPSIFYLRSLVMPLVIVSWHVRQNHRGWTDAPLIGEYSPLCICA